MGKTALSVAAYAGNMDIFEMLVNHGAMVDCEDNRGWNVLHEAILGKFSGKFLSGIRICPKSKIFRHFF